MNIKRILFAALLLGLLLPAPLTRHARAIASHQPQAVYQFVEVETSVYRKGEEISEQNPQERRWYISNVIVQPEDVPTYSLIKKTYMPYFSKNVMDPSEARGIAVDYGDQDIRLNGETSYANYETRAEAEAERLKAIEYRKGQSGNIFSFEIDLKDPKGEATSKPKLIYRDKEQPLYDKVK